MSIDITVGGVAYRIHPVQQADGWTAYAERVDTGRRFGVECAAATELEAIDRVGRWLAWQDEHAVALAALQEAESAYHRTIAGSAFASPTEGPSPIELQQESLDALEAARTRLDDIRARKPL